MMGRLIYFDISSDFGFFKKPDINKFSLTYNLPPKPAILGILGSILGMKGLNQHYEENLKLGGILKIGETLAQDFKKAKREINKLNFGVIKRGLEQLGFRERERLLQLLELLKSSKEKDFEVHKEGLGMIISGLSSELQYPEYYRKLAHLKIGMKPLGPEGSFPFNKIMNKYNSKNSYFYTKIDEKQGRYDDNALISEQLLIKPKYCIYVYEEGEQSLLKDVFLRIKNNAPVFMPYLGKNEFIANFGSVSK